MVISIIPLKIETGIYWIPDKINNLESPEFTYLKVDLNRASSKAKRHSIATLWRWRNEGFKDTKRRYQKSQTCFDKSKVGRYKRSQNLGLLHPYIDYLSRL